VKNNKEKKPNINENENEDRNEDEVINDDLEVNKKEVKLLGKIRKNSDQSSPIVNDKNELKNTENSKIKNTQEEKNEKDIQQKKKKKIIQRVNIYILLMHN